MSVRNLGRQAEENPVKNMHFMKKCIIEQKEIVDNNAAPEYKVTMVNKFYGVKTDGTRVYDVAVDHITIPDYLVKLFSLAETDQALYFSVMKGIEQIFAKEAAEFYGTETQVE